MTQPTLDLTRLSFRDYVVGVALVAISIIVLFVLAGALALAVPQWLISLVAVVLGLVAWYYYLLWNLRRNAEAAAASGPIAANVNVTAAKPIAAEPAPAAPLATPAAGVAATSLTATEPVSAPAPQTPPKTAKVAAAKKPAAKPAPVTAAAAPVVSKSKSVAEKPAPATRSAATPAKAAPVKAATPKPAAAPKKASTASTAGDAKAGATVIAAKPAVAANAKAAPKQPAAAKKTTPAKAASAAGAAVETKPAASSATAATLFSAPTGAPDDLKLISGVGPVLEGKLNSLGITKWSQVAAFKAADITKVEDSLSFKGRVTRDNWLAQAAALAKGGEAEYVRVFGKKPR